MSTEGQEHDGTSLRTQLEACREYCEARRYEIGHELSEAWSGLSLERPKLIELRELMRVYQEFGFQERSEEAETKQKDVLAIA